MANKVITNATIYTGKGVLENAFVRFDKQILEVGSMADFQADKAEEVIDAKGQKLVPGFIDVHSHGGYSFDAMDADS
ncbi:N-acetylglucosamine-6-phosphate deacetylase, partial [Listeria monocytogenes]|nr:N-acetylglucosamine-6-phosphate deacetylase [Listeria monocytogenes]MCG4290989.1 N-acetylglucosamine-6-phosphate deacetylase [Listeria monocytogenes]